MSAPGTADGELASRLVARLCHDFAGPVGGILSGVELLDDPASPIPREEALALVQESACSLSIQLKFARVAFGVGEETYATDHLESLARDVFGAIRPSLEWMIEPSLMPAAAARVLLNLVQLAAAAVAGGGVVQSRADRDSGGFRLRVEALGLRATLYPEVLAGLKGEARDEGLAGRWVQGAFVHALLQAAGGEMDARVDEGAVRFTARLPASAPG